MTAVVHPEAISQSGTTPSSTTPSSTTQDLPDEIRWAAGSTLLGLFAVALFDQAALPEVSAALARTGRIRSDALGRATRSAASHQIITWGTNEDRAAEAERLKTLHRTVRGTNEDGRPYSALAPDLWMFIQASSIIMTRNGVATLLGRELTPDEDEALYTYVLHDLEALQLGRGAHLPGTWSELLTWYEHMLPRIERTESLDDAFRNAHRPPAPPTVPAPLRPAWRLLRQPVGRTLVVLGLGVMHPDARQRMPINWGAAEDVQFKILSTCVATAYRRLPKRITLSPLAYNRWRYEQLITHYRAVGLQSFDPQG